MAKVNVVDNTSNFKQNNVLRNTVIASGTGAAISSTIEYNGQKLLIKKGNVNAASGIMKKMIDKKAFCKEGIVIAGAIGAAIVGGIYLLGMGIKTIVFHDKK